jgi:hypothetical protein
MGRRRDRTGFGDPTRAVSDGLPWAQRIGFLLVFKLTHTAAHLKQVFQNPELLAQLSASAAGSRRVLKVASFVSDCKRIIQIVI